MGKHHILGDRHKEPAKITKMEWSWKLRSTDFQEGVKGYGGQTDKGQNASFRSDNKNAHLTTAAAVSVGGMNRSL